MDGVDIYTKLNRNCFAMSIVPRTQFCGPVGWLGHFRGLVANGADKICLVYTTNYTVTMSIGLVQEVSLCCNCDRKIRAEL